MLLRIPLLESRGIFLQIDVEHELLCYNTPKGMYR